jgi:hypothetical protein
MRVLSFLGIGVVFLVIFACKRNDSPPLDSGAKAEIEKSTGVELPADTRLLAASAGDRDSAMEFQEWIFFSPSLFHPPMTGNKGIPGNASVPTTPVIKHIEALTGQKIPHDSTTAAFDLWTKGNHEFRGTLLKTQAGYFFVVQRNRTSEF